MKTISVIFHLVLLGHLVGCGHSVEASSSKSTESSDKTNRVAGVEISASDSRGKRSFFLNDDIESIDIYCWCLKLKNGHNDSVGKINAPCTTVIDFTYKEMMKEQFHKKHLTTADVANFYNEFNSIEGLQLSNEKITVDARILFFIKYKNQTSDTIAQNASGKFVLNSYYYFELPDFDSRIRKIVPAIDNLCD